MNMIVGHWMFDQSIGSRNLFFPISIMSKIFTEDWHNLAKNAKTRNNATNYLV